MRLLTILAASATMSFAPPLVAQAAAVPDFKPLEFLVGHCWIGTFPNGKQTDEHCFEWVFDRKFIRDHHAVRDVASPAAKYQGETLYGWDAMEKHLAYWYWNSDGQMITGTVAYEGNDIVFPGRYDTPKGPVDLKAVWTPLVDGYRVSQSQRAGSEWTPLWTMTLKATSRDRKSVV